MIPVTGEQREVISLSGQVSPNFKFSTFRDMTRKRGKSHQKLGQSTSIYPTFRVRAVHFLKHVLIVCTFDAIYQLGKTVLLPVVSHQ